MVRFPRSEKIPSKDYQSYFSELARRRRPERQCSVTFTIGCGDCRGTREMAQKKQIKFNLLRQVGFALP
jgi:hypothetical protein